MIASNFQNFPERIPSRIKRDTNKLAICLRTQKKKKNSQSSKFRREGFSRKSLNLESRKEGKGSALKRRARSKGAFTPVQDRATKFPDNSIHPNSWLIDGYQPLFFFFSPNPPTTLWSFDCGRKWCASRKGETSGGGGQTGIVNMDPDKKWVRRKARYWFAQTIRSLVYSTSEILRIIVRDFSFKDSNGTNSLSTLPSQKKYVYIIRILWCSLHKQMNRFEKEKF